MSRAWVYSRYTAERSYDSDNRAHFAASGFQSESNSAVKPKFIVAIESACLRQARFERGAASVAPAPEAWIRTEV